MRSNDPIIFTSLSDVGSDRAPWLIFLIIFLAVAFNESALATPPKQRVDLGSSYTIVDVGDWQTFNASYTLQTQGLTTGVAARVFRREFPGEAPTDLSLQVPLYTNLGPFSLEVWGEWSPQPTFVPQYSLQVSPSYRIAPLLSALHLTYRFAQYAVASAQMITPGYSWHNPQLGWATGVFFYITVPEFGGALYTPQLRLEYYLSYFWRIELWFTYGYETLNDRFVDPARQAPHFNLYGQLKHLFSDYSGIYMGLSWANFLPPNAEIAQERFNRDRLEISVRTFFRF